ncbi:RNA-binding protein Pasilla [Culicoides brevitarsis]|uniref:RNA-binding protein Pasilla n=1 Tax=Culicoides brevitarsis TaxID=469753 RepID=UPI00307C6522
MAADNGSEIECPSPDVGDSRKRPLDGDVDSSLTKRSHFSSGEASATYHFKTLIPSVAAGAIIGKGGETIASLQKETSARVKMSKSHDFYPGTTERICLITGTPESILTVLDFIMDKIREKPDLTKPSVTELDSKQTHEREKQVKILVPNSTAGMIIGKAGAFIKQIKEESGSYIQISQKPKDLALQERCVTIVGEKDHNKIACKLILSKIIEDPLSGTCTNVSYADINGPVANFNPTGSPYASHQTTNFNSSTASLNSSVTTNTGNTNLMINGTGLHLTLNLGAPANTASSAITTQFLDQIKTVMRNSGYNDSVIAEVCTALSILAKYGILGIGFGLNTTNPAVNCFNLPTLEQTNNTSTTNNVLGAIGQINLDSYIGAVSPSTGTSLEGLEMFRSSTMQANAPLALNNNNFSISGNQSVQPNFNKSMLTPETTSKEKNVEIPEVIVGAILGPGGRSLIEIQHVSGANIQISKKGTFAPGTRNRIVTITGQPSAITMAHYLIEQRISEEEMKRACQIKLPTNVIQ